ncbi:Repeat domain-containing protein [Pustulibacterium marinum]|uniref:Repeat domain-containing protein n=1 Tax=Pustulibacterium marinum TaxID=1224947 RepID=A0A1I7EYX1_9FLAO|nr:VCBS repeat-containing protein [Pustulibacterium marinum]SFU29097.1 Repeat domain-containing protein [Pustulibacterium marinum]
MNRFTHKIKQHSLVFLGLMLVLISCGKKENKRFAFLEANDTHITFSNTLSDTPDWNILRYLYYYNGGGVATADFNNDGLQDIYFTGNQVADQLYLNKGNFQFEEITAQANIENTTNWTTGVTVVDINNDGLLDIYVCKIGNYRGVHGKNLLFVNQGVQNGIPTFKEAAAAYQLDFSGFSTQAIFFDYDVDGDLDCFLLNHSVHPNSSYGNGKKRKTIDADSGDKLLRNDQGKFTDVSSEAGIYQGEIGYGLGISVSDINNDGYPDIYIGNDFFENDYLYINNQNGTFSEVISQQPEMLGHTSHYSMGNTLTDINNDGNTDIISLDMLPEDLKTYKTSGLEFGFQTYNYYLKNGYAPQFMQNTLHVNNGNQTFSETGYASGIAATEWSWGTLAADFDNDGFKDLYISNGIKGATNDMDFVSFIANDQIQKRINQGMTEKDMAFIQEMPEKKVPNYFFKNNGNQQFSDSTETWFQKIPSFSNGAVYTDLDNDGDLDLVVNNINDQAFILENRSETFEQNNYLSIQFKGPKTNTFGIGAKVNLYVKDQIITEENFVSKGYLSAVAPQLHVGLGNSTTIDSLEVIWPGGKSEVLKNIKTNTTLSIQYKDASDSFQKEKKKVSLLVNSQTQIPFVHNDAMSIEFNRNPLIPFASTNEGPDICVGDINNDGLEDVFITGAKRQASALFFQNADGSFQQTAENLFKTDEIAEDVSAIFSDVDNDNDLDLIVVSAGNEFKKGTALQPRLYLNEKGIFTKLTSFINLEINASKVIAKDITGNGFEDIIITSSVQPWEFGITPKQYIFENQGNLHFKETTDQIAKGFKEIGCVESVTFTDVNGDHQEDMLVIGKWMAPKVFIQNNHQFTMQKSNGLENEFGWWNTIKAADFDNDGDIDFVAGNWGFNTRLTAGEHNPIQLYSYDFDHNGKPEPLVSYFYKGEETPFASKDELVKQMPFLNKKYLSYKTFANTSFESIFGKENLEKAYHKKVTELGSCYFENLGHGKFQKHLLPFEAQISSVNAIDVDDYNNDGLPDLLLAGNNYEISTQLGRLDASHGVLLLNQGDGTFKTQKNTSFDISGPARNIKTLKNNTQTLKLITTNNGKIVILNKLK